MQTLAIVISILVLIILLLWYVFPGFTSSLIVNSGIRVLGLHHQRQRIGDTDFHWLESTGTGPVLVMVHGLNGDASNWIMMAPQLKKYRLVIPDMPPFGESSYNISETPDYSIHAQAERLDALMQHLGIEKFYLAGNSMGGYISGDYASNHPDKLLGLLLLSPGAVKSVPFLKHFAADLEAGLNPLRVENKQDLEQLKGYCFSKPPVIPGPVLQTLFARMLSISDQCTLIFQEMINDTPGIEVMLAGSAVPTLIIWGKEDNILNPAGAPVLQKVMKNAELVMPEKTGHVPMMEYPKVTAETMLAFIQKQENRLTK